MTYALYRYTGSAVSRYTGTLMRPHGPIIQVWIIAMYRLTGTPVNRHTGMSTHAVKKLPAIAYLAAIQFTRWPYWLVFALPVCRYAGTKNQASPGFR
ncbi:MAG: hypothetical protein FLDDKLPJ_03671 [Phycisphaerae bacterium]|nr:hypothetical protein [Phycisphaerae bacterium]